MELSPLEAEMFEALKAMVAALDEVEPYSDQLDLFEDAYRLWRAVREKVEG